MKNLNAIWVAGVLAAGTLLPGCGSMKSTRLAAADAPSASASSQAADPIPQLSEEELEKRIQSSAHFAAGLSYDLEDDPEKALAEYWEAAKNNPGYEPLSLEVARRMIRAKNPEKAIEILKSASVAPGASGAVFAWLGVAYAQAGQREPAITANLTAIKKAPSSLPPYQNLAQLYLQQGKTNDAVRVLDQAAQQVGVTAEFLVDLAELYDRFGRLQILKQEFVKPKAIAALDRAEALAPRNPQTLQKLGDGFLLLGEPAKAETVYHKLLQDFPEIPGIHEKLVDVYVRLGKKPEAARELESILRQNPTNPQPYLFLAEFALNDKKYESAADYLEKAILLNPDLELAYLRLAGLKLTLKKPREALDLLEKAREKFNKPSFDLEFYAGIGNALLKNYSDAIKHYTAAEIIAKAGDTNNLSAQFYFQVGSACERAGNLENAEKEFQIAIDLAPDFAEALNYLGYMWADRGTKLDQAREMIEKALKLEPENPAYLDSLGWVLFKLKKPQEALGFLLKAIERSPEPDPTLFDHLGDIYAALQQYGPAREAWQKSIRLEPNEQLETIRKKLQSAPSKDRSSH